MSDRPNPEIAEQDLLTILSEADLRARGLNGEVLKALHADSFQTHPDQKNGYLGALVANLMARQSNVPSEKTPLVSAYLLAERVGIPLEGLLDLERDGRKIVEEHTIEGVPDLYIHVGDVHICVPDTQVKGLTSLANLYATTHNQLYRTRLATEGQKIVREVAERVHAKLPSFVDLEDLIGEGNIGLLDAIEKYDPTMNVKFETYAPPRVRGAILDGIRASDHLPRLDRTRLEDLEVFAHQFKESHGIVPSKEDLYAEWERRNLPLDSFEHFYSDVWIRGGNIASLDAERKSTKGFSGSQKLQLKDGVVAPLKYNPLTECENVDLLNCFERDLCAIPERYREPLRRIIMDGITLAQAGDEAEPPFSESRMSQITTLYLKSGSFFPRTRAYLNRAEVITLKL